MSERDWNWERQLHGIIPPLISPLDDTGAPDAGAIAALARIYQQGPWRSALKAACAMLGLGNGRPAPPLAPAAREAIAVLLDEAGLGAAAAAAGAR